MFPRALQFVTCDTGLLEFGSCLCFRQDTKMDSWSSTHVCLCVWMQCRLELLCRGLKLHGWSSQRSLHSAPIFRLLLKVAVNGTHQCDSHNFWGALSSNKQTNKQRTNCCRRNRVGLLLLNKTSTLPRNFTGANLNFPMFGL